MAPFGVFCLLELRLAFLDIHFIKNETLFTFIVSLNETLFAFVDFEPKLIYYDCHEANRPNT